MTLGKILDVRVYRLEHLDARAAGVQFSVCCPATPVPWSLGKSSNFAGPTLEGSRKSDGYLAVLKLPFVWREDSNIQMSGLP